MGVEAPVLDEAVAPQAMALGNRPRALTAAEYSGVTRIMPSPAYSDGRGGHAIDRIVIHITSAGQTPYIGSWFTREDANSSAHYMVDQNGAIIQFVREQDTSWHARGANQRSIGIEHVAVERGGATYGSTHYPYTPPSAAEYAASAELVAHLCFKYGLTPDRTTIIGHREADPGTSHSLCPDGAWDWDAYMPLVEQCYVALASMGVPRAQGLAYSRGLEVDPETMGIDGPACSENCGAPAVAASLALTAKDYDRASRIAPSPAFNTGRAGTAIDRIVIHITDAPTTGSTVSHFTRADANSSAHYLVGQDGEVIQFVAEADTAWHAKGSNRRGIGIEHVAVKQGGATYGSTTFPYMPPTDVQYRESAELVSRLCFKYGLAPNRTTIIGHREADTGTSHTSCPDGAWDWDRYMGLVATCYAALATTGQGLGSSSRPRPAAVALGAGDQIVEIKYRAFIPAPLIKGPLSDYDLGSRIASGEDFGGDNRTFSYDGGTSRGEITATLLLGADGSISNLQTVDRHWGESKAYDSSYTYHVDGKPDWWMDKHAGLEPSRRATLQADDDNLRIYRGASGMPRNILAVTSNSAVVTVEMSGSLPLISPSPAVDADIAIFLKPGVNGVQVMVVGDHDGFPCHELYINGVQFYIYDPVAEGNDPGNLLPPTDREISTNWFTIPSRTTAAAQSMSATAQGLFAGSAPSRALDADDWSINWDEVEQIAQPTDMSCWATAAAMLVGWRDRQCVSPEMLANFHGLTSSLTGGLAPGDKQAFADALGLVVHANACYTPEGFREILEANGPIWVTAKVPFVHAIVVTGMYRENGQFFVRITDPLDRVVGTPGAPGARTSPPTHNNGSRYIMTYDAFSQEFEAAGDIDRIQLLHNGGAHGHTINRGGAQAAGYAQALARPSSRALDVDDWSINWDDVFLVPQPTNVSCWATAASMIDGWRRRQSVSIDSIAEFDNLTTHQGLPPSSAARFAADIGFTVHPNACYTPEGFRGVIEWNGPVWVAARVPFLHAIVVTGMYRENGQYFVRITDPWDRVVGTPGSPGSYASTHTTGSQYIMTYDAFAAEFEAAGDLDFAQLLHTNGTHGHTLNRGSARMAGYAQALDLMQPPARSGGGDESLGFGTSLTRSTFEKPGRRYDLAQLSGMVTPENSLAGGAGVPALPGERVVLDDWPFIPGPSGRTQVGIAIDWQYQGGAVGNVVVTPIEGQVLDGWEATVRADIRRGDSTLDRVQLRIRVVTTFSRAGVEDQVAVTEVDLSGDGRQQTRHGADQGPITPVAPRAPAAPELPRRSSSKPPERARGAERWHAIFRRRPYGAVSPRP